jgi:hypothetical protein
MTPKSALDRGVTTHISREGINPFPTGILRLPQQRDNAPGDRPLRGAHRRPVADRIRAIWISQIRD